MFRALGPLVALVAVAGLLSSPTALADAQPLRVVASFSVLADMARQVGGEQVEVRSLVGPDGDPHVYQPTPADVQALAGADVVIRGGLGIDRWLDRLVAAADYKGPIVDASAGVPVRLQGPGDADHEHHHDHGDHGHDHDHEHAGDEHAAHEDDAPATDANGRAVDPHAWTSAANGAIYAANILKGLVAADPSHAQALTAKGEAYVAELKALDDWARAELAAIPAERRRVISSHAAFGYLGDAYGITFHAPVGLSTDAEPSAAEIAALIQQIRTENIRAIFIENATDPRLVQQLARETNAVVGGALYAESLSASDGPAATYVAMIRHNIETLKAGMAAP
ncbi:metal ABC transporter solute-binding protein, Zn/Mn family [Zavarzinia sp. CC-PAN008]|uniref:metal ABC transporter solute-binding protein, Zn/Mn family n=1 Tax=Zavarzinia sp. CC-PAN008 TaxID=3243332 RepID=UPI003F742B37